MDDHDYSHPDDGDLFAGYGPLLTERPEITVPDTPEAAVQAAQDQEEAAQLTFRRLVNERKMYHRANRAATRELDAEEAAASKPEPATPLDWSTFLTQELPPPDWHAGRLLAQGQQGALIGDGKAGKSMFALELAWRDSAGLPFLGDKPRRPRRVVYIDHENSQDDIQGRLRSLGATPETLTNLIYLSFPPHRPLDTEAGAADALADVQRHAGEMVYLDTASRVISGEENGPDAWLKLYSLFLKQLKAARITSLRLDHFGKDPEKGARGSSAKTQDIDVVWELKTTEKGGNILTLSRTFTRNGIGRGFYRIERQGEIEGERWAAGKTRHVLVDADAPTGGAKPGEFIGAAAIADQLDAAGISVDLGRDKVREIIRSKHPEISCNNTLLGDAIKLRRKRRDGPVAASPDTLDGNPFGADMDALRASVARCRDCGRLPGDEWHEINCVYRASTPEHVADIFKWPIEDVARIRAEWENRAA